MFRAVASHSSAQIAMSAGSNALGRSSSGSASTRIVGPLASKLKDIRQNTHANLKLQLQKNLPPLKFEQACELAEQIETAEPDFNQLHARVEEFVQRNKNDPEAIVSALKYLNSQLMILSTAERQMKAQDAPITQSLMRGLKTLIDNSASRGESIVQRLSNTKISPVFTAHPTNFNKPQASEIVLSQLDNIASPQGNAKVCQELWEIQGVRELKPTVQDEANQFSANIRHLHSSGRTIHEQINQQLSGLPNNLKLSKPLVEAGNWVGGDRDGNPNIDATVLKDVVKTLSTAAFEYFEQEIGKEKNTQTGSLCNLLCKSGHSESLGLIREKLARTRTHLVGNSPLPIQGDLYLNANELVHDLESLSIASLDTQEKAAVQEKLDLLKLDADSIGFHGASTDIRQNSAMNEKTVGELLRRSGGPSNYESLGEIEKQTLLTNLLLNKQTVLSDAPIDGQSENAEFDREIALIKSYKTIHDSYGPQALKNCITANTETMSDMLEVMLLLKHAGLADEQGIKMNVVPLIETVNDLHNGPAILNSMLSNPWYRQALQASGNQQQIMVGYSDSNRLDGPLASSWAVYEGTAKMLEVAEQRGVSLHVFHGRGGTEARGSGDSYAQEIKSSNGASLLTGMRQTEQGEEVPAKFGTKTMSQSNLADMVGSTLETMATGKDQQIAKYASTMEKLAQHARNHYESLYSNPELPHFFQSSTPIEFVGKSNAGSRPASRANTAGGGLNLDKLRAIPWVGSWYQSGSAMPAFFGTGSALKNFIDQPAGANTTPAQRTAQLQTMYQEWPFFKSFIDRTATAMEKADMQIAQQYAKLAPVQSQGVFEAIKNEYELTKEMILSIKQSNDLMDHNPADAEILAVKKPLTQAAHAMQIGLLKAHQQAGPEIQDRLVEPIVMSMQAIASSNRFG
ncbi:MAG: hypothetical protein DCE88_01270 [Betaproteobacteria bacterium]|jgi:phosphoenolpyruvate carboxylase|nr:hypothetical protein [Alcaligenaceae bacterium]PZO24177.1 MAG: hypothetical protein DCE89_07305 [Betaproteobacteria bacterium]PZO32346.1 MAG: hypothetical protein DCE88_01270 [Betaproteobacteria bacterium]